MPLINHDHQTVCVPPFIWQDLTDIFDIVRCDVESAQPLRGVDGKCIPTPPGIARFG